MLPISSPGIENGAVATHGGTITAVGTWREISRNHRGEVLDIGEVALLPGLVNAHCHLDYTDMAGHLPPMPNFTDWLKLITELKAGWTYDDYARSWQHGAGMLLRSGCTSVADIEAVPELLPAMWRRTPLRVFSFLEMIGINVRRPPEKVISEIKARLRVLAKNGSWIGISPHAPYSTVPDLLKQSAALARKAHLRVCIHIAESKLEYEMFSKARGEMFQWMQKSGRNMSDCGRVTPVSHSRSCGVLNDRVLAVHMNYLGHGDVELLRRSRAHIVHCPRSHDYFGHEAFPLERLRRAGLNVCIGTDSLASVLKTRGEKVQLNMFHEMQALLKKFPGVSPRTALRMSTVAGAAALGMQGKIGEIAPGACADLVAVPVSNPARILESVAHYRGDVLLSMVRGKWAIKPPNTERRGRHRQALSGAGNK